MNPISSPAHSLKGSSYEGEPSLKKSKMKKQVTIEEHEDEVNEEFKVILTESKINEIKRVVGSAFLNILKQTTFRKIIKRQTWHRSAEDNRRLVDELKRQEVFKKFWKLKDEDFLQMARQVTYQEIAENKELHREQEPVKNFYILLRGRMGFEERNPLIKNWEWAKKAEKDLTQWKKEEFDVKVKKEIQLSMIKTKLKTDTKQILKFNTKRHQSVLVRGEMFNPLLLLKSQNTHLNQHEINIHMRMMDNIRRNYHQAKKKYMKSTLAKRLSQNNQHS